MNANVPADTASKARTAETTVYPVLWAISFAHLLNDTIQALLPSIYPLLKSTLQLNYTQIGLITLTFQCTASLLQPVVGFVTDRRSKPYSLVLGMGLTLCGLIWLSMARSFPMVVMASGLVGMGSSVFHPEASRVAYLAAGPRRGLAQSLFQVGGNAGTSIGPLLAALIIVPRGQSHLAWFCLAAGLGMMVLWRIGRWQAELLRERQQQRAVRSIKESPVSQRLVVSSLAVLVVLTFSKYVYLASLTNYYTFYMMERFHVSMQTSQFCLFAFLFAVAAGTIIGGPIGDRFGRKRVIWASILGVAPFSLWLPHAGFTMTIVLSVIIGIVLASAFSAILVYAQELLPGREGMIAGLFFGLAFGIAGISSAALGKAADSVGIVTVFQHCAWLPLLGLFTVFLPNLKKK